MPAADDQLELKSLGAHVESDILSDLVRNRAASRSGTPIAAVPATNEI